MKSHQPFGGQGYSPLVFPHVREDPLGFEAEEDYPLSKEELLSQVMKSVRIGKGSLWGWARMVALL